MLGQYNSNRATLSIKTSVTPVASIGIWRFFCAKFYYERIGFFDIMKSMKRKPFPLVLLLLLATLAIVNGLATVYSWYFFVPWLDMPMHFFAGVWIGGVALWLYLGGQSNEHGEVLSTRRISLVTFLVVLSVGVFWEIFQFGLDRVVEFAPIYDIGDTLSDLFFDVFGGLVAVYIVLSRRRGK